MLTTQGHHHSQIAEEKKLFSWELVCVCSWFDPDNKKRLDWMLIVNIKDQDFCL